MGFYVESFLHGESFPDIHVATAQGERQERRLGSRAKALRAVRSLLRFPQSSGHGQAAFRQTWGLETLRDRARGESSDPRRLHWSRWGMLRVQVRVMKAWPGGTEGKGDLFRQHATVKPVGVSGWYCPCLTFNWWHVSFFPVKNIDAAHTWIILKGCSNTYWRYCTISKSILFSPF